MNQETYPITTVDVRIAAVLNEITQIDAAIDRVEALIEAATNLPDLKIS